MAQTKTTREIKNRVRLYQLLIFVALMGLVGYGFSRYVLAPAQSSSSVPEYVGSLKLVSRVEGAAAQADINQLHGTSINLKNAFIADYDAPYGGNYLKVWAGEAGSRAAASDLIDRMVKGIASGGSGFSNPRQVKVAGHDVWQADGKGGQFFFYISQETPDRVVWLTIESKSSAALLESAVKVF